MRVEAILVQPWKYHFAQSDAVTPDVMCWEWLSATDTSICIELTGIDSPFCVVSNSSGSNFEFDCFHTPWKKRGASAKGGSWFLVHGMSPLWLWRSLRLCIKVHLNAQPGFCKQSPLRGAGPYSTQKLPIVQGTRLVWAYLSPLI